LKFYAQRRRSGIVANIYYKLFDYKKILCFVASFKTKGLVCDVGQMWGILLYTGSWNMSDVIAFEPIPSTFW
jgi:hypothetical protein